MLPDLDLRKSFKIKFYFWLSFVENTNIIKNVFLASNPSFSRERKFYDIADSNGYM